MKKFIMLGLVMLLSACSVVGPGERGVAVSLGKASNEVREPGAYLWIPFLYGSKIFNVQVQKSEIETSAASKDMQEITTHLAVNWSITPDKVSQVYQTVGDEDDVLVRLLQPAVSEVLKACAAKAAAEEILTKRMELKNEIDTMLRERLAHYGITINDVSIVNLTFSKDFTNAIEAKQIAEQQAKQAAYDAQKAVELAKAEVNRARGQAESQQLLKSTITSEVLQMKAIEKWNGQFPQVMGSGTVPFLNIQGMR